MALNMVSTKSTSAVHLGFLARGSQVLTGHARVPSHKNIVRKASSLTVRRSIIRGSGGVIPSVIPKPKDVARKDFPADFKFGCSSSAIQTEGAAKEGGRGPSILDHYIEDGNGNNNAVDSYHRYKEDVQLLKAMGVDAYRFSISWSRILPDGTVSGINQEGVDFYNNFIDELLKNGITPVVTIFHFDLPTTLQNKYNGFLSSQIVDDFKAYADVCFQKFGDRVKHWITVNEPQVFGLYLYTNGLSVEIAEANVLTGPFLVVHNMLLAHATAVQLYTETYKSNQKGEIGLSMVTEWYEPHGDSLQDEDAARRAFDFMVGWILEPLVYGDYPFIMKALVRDGLPAFTDDQKALVKGSFDFIGANYYTSRYATALPINPNETYTSQDQFQHVTLTTDRNGKLIGPLAPGNDTAIYPQGLRKILVFITQHYNSPKIYITENGYPDKRNDAIPVEAALQDNARIQHILSHLFAISQAMQLGANVNGYFAWNLLDTLEITDAYRVRFGLNYTDYLDDLKRIPKKSAAWLKSFLGGPI